MDLPDGDGGASLIEVALIMPVLVLLLLGAVDLGRGYFVMLEVGSAAEAGALYGTQNTTDVSGMNAAAKLDAPDVSNLSPSASYGCECSDGTSVVVSCGTAPTCAYNVVNWVEVDTSASYVPLVNLPGIPNPIKLAATSRLRSPH